MRGVEQTLYLIVLLLSSFDLELYAGAASLTADVGANKPNTDRNVGMKTVSLLGRSKGAVETRLDFLAKAASPLTRFGSKLSETKQELLTEGTLASTRPHQAHDYLKAHDISASFLGGAHPLNASDASDATSLLQVDENVSHPHAAASASAANGSLPVAKPANVSAPEAKEAFDSIPAADRAPVPLPGAKPAHGSVPKVHEALVVRSALWQRPSLSRVAAMLQGGTRDSGVSYGALMIVAVAVIMTVLLVMYGGAEKRNDNYEPPMQFLRNNHPGDIYPPLVSARATAEPSLTSCPPYIPNGPTSSYSVTSHMRDPRYASGDLGDPRSHRSSSSVLRRGPFDGDPAPWSRHSQGPGV